MFIAYRILKILKLRRSGISHFVKITHEHSVRKTYHSYGVSKVREMLYYKL